MSLAPLQVGRHADATPPAEPGALTGGPRPSDTPAAGEVGTAAVCQGSALAAGPLGLSLCRPCNAPATGEVETKTCGLTHHVRCLLLYHEVTRQERCPQKCARASTVDRADATMSAIRFTARTSGF